MHGHEAEGSGSASGGARFALAAGLLGLAVATLLMVRRVEPFVTWYYLFAWYPVLLAADGAVALRGEFLLLSRPRHLLSVLFWSAIIWLFYELFNLRLQNWYYVNVPAERWVRWTFTFVAFATVLPAVFLSERLLAGFGVAMRTAWRPLRLDAARLRGIQLAGVMCLVLVLAWPRLFFPLVWGATTLFIEPIVYRRAPDRSILGDLESGRPGRLLRLLLGGMAIGLTWEALNIGARAKWIYTVPGLEELKLFEMPVLGFFGFPPFAVECFVLWQALVLAGLAVPRERDDRVRTSVARRSAGVAGATLFAGLVLSGMEGGRTWDSLRPSLSALAGVDAPALRAAGIDDPFELAAVDPGTFAATTAIEPARARDWVEEARLATLRGIGAENAMLLRTVGIATVRELAEADPDSLVAALRVATSRRIVPARVRVWVRAAREAVEGA